MPYIARLYGMRKNSVPSTSRRSTSRAVSRYAAANGYAVFTQLSGREETRSALSIGIPPGGEVPARRQQQDGGDRVREVLDRGDADAESADPVGVVADEADRDHHIV